jgi:hypothetical protein
MHSAEMLKLIKENKHLFWSVRSEDLDGISLDIVVETILNYADVKEIRTLIELTGIENVARIYYKQTGRNRNNYHKQTINFFNHYFKRHAQANIIT